MDPTLESEPRPDTPAAGNAMVWMTLSVFAFGVFLVAIPGQDPAGRTWLWVGVVLLLLGGGTSFFTVRARRAYLREHRTG